VVILGHTGFIGRPLLECLQRCTESTVFGYSTSVVDLRNPKSLEVLDGVVDEQTIVVMCAGLTPNQVKPDTVEMFEANLAMVVNVARYLQEHRVGKCIYLSGVAVYGRRIHSLSITEDSPIIPDTYYGAAQFAGECVLQNQAAHTGMPLLVLRPCRVFGPGDIHADYGPSGFIKSILAERALYLRGDGTELRGYLYIKDIVRLICDLGFSNACGVYNLATGRSHSPLEVIEHLREIVPYELDVRHPPAPGYGWNQGFDIAKLSKALPGLHFTDLGQSLRETYEAFSTQLADTR
jgi:UDP-glucose 4-epimerase